VRRGCDAKRSKERSRGIGRLKIGPASLRKVTKVTRNRSPSDLLNQEFSGRIKRDSRRTPHRIIDDSPSTLTTDVILNADVICGKYRCASAFRDSKILSASKRWKQNEQTTKTAELRFNLLDPSESILASVFDSRQVSRRIVHDSNFVIRSRSLVVIRARSNLGDNDQRENNCEACRRE